MYSLLINCYLQIKLGQYFCVGFIHHECFTRVVCVVSSARVHEQLGTQLPAYSGQLMVLWHTFWNGSRVCQVACAQSLSDFSVVPAMQIESGYFICSGVCPLQCVRCSCNGTRRCYYNNRSGVLNCLGDVRFCDEYRGYKLTDSVQLSSSWHTNSCSASQKNYSIL